MAFPQTGVELVVKNAKGFFGTLDKAGGKVAGFGKAAATAAIAGTAAVIGFAAVVGGASVKAAIDFESAFAGVIKTTDGLVDEMGNVNEAGREMQQEFRNLAKEVPVAVEELLAIGELGGQLGIASDQLVGFAETIAAVGEATNLTTEEAATGFAQLANIMQTPQDQIENMASSVVALGNNFATTERDILTFGQRIAGAGEIVGLTEAQVFAIGAAFSSVGVQAEAGGTAVQKVLIGINSAVQEGGDQLEIFAATAGLSAEEFAVAFEEDAGAAFTGFVEGLGLAGDDALAILSALGLEDQRLIRSFLSLAGAGDLLSESMELSTEAFAENTALTKEAEARYRTTESQFKILKNTVKDLGITIGQALLPFVSDLLKMAQPLIAEIGQRLPGFLNNLLIPAIRNVAQWLGIHLPIAIQMASSFWQTTLQPAIEQIATFISGTLIPTLTEVFNWLSENIPLAIQTLSDFWTDTLQPAIEQVWAFVEENLLPILAGIAAIVLTVVVPAFVTWAAGAIAAAVATAAAMAPVIVAVALVGAAVALLVKAWQEDWNGIRTKLTEVWEGTLRPALVNLKAWLDEKIPQAIETLKGFWENTLKPALEDLKSFIEDPVIPAIKKLFEWLNDRITEAFQAVQSFWEGTLKPALEDLKTFIEDPVIPVIEKLFEWLKEKIPEAFQAVKDFWNNVLKPAFNALWGFVRDNIVPILEKMFEWLGEKIPEAFEAVQNFWNTTGKRVFDRIKEALETIIDVLGRIVSAVQTVIDWLGRIKVPDIKLPDWLTPGSPTPLEIGIEGIAGALRQFQQVAASLEPATMNIAASVLRTADAQAVAASSASTITNNTVNFNTNVTNGMQASQFEQRVLRIVQEGLR